MCWLGTGAGRDRRGARGRDRVRPRAGSGARCPAARYWHLGRCGCSGRVALTATVFASRLMPFVSFDMISYAAGSAACTLAVRACDTGGIVRQAPARHFGGEAVSGDLGPGDMGSGSVSGRDGVAAALVAIRRKPRSRSRPPLKVLELPTAGKRKLQQRPKAGRPWSTITITRRPTFRRGRIPQRTRSAG